jgi:uncharacterized protein YaaR (DUF327 family)
MRINNLLTPKTIGKKKSSANTYLADNDSLLTTSFGKHLKEIESYTKEIEDLKISINSAGDMLENEPNIPNFKKFRELLSQLAKRINAEAYRLEKVGGTPQHPRYFEVIHVINSEADKLYKLILSEQRNRIAIIEKVIGIKGLVVSLIT